VHADIDGGLLAAAEEALEERDGGHAAVAVVHVLDVNAVLLKAFRTVVLLVEAHDQRDVALLEVLEVVLGHERAVSVEERDIVKDVRGSESNCEHDSRKM
jgi:hypothetical protein